MNIKICILINFILISSYSMPMAQWPSRSLQIPQKGQTALKIQNILESIRQEEQKRILLEQKQQRQALEIKVLLENKQYEIIWDILSKTQPNNILNLLIQSLTKDFKRYFFELIQLGLEAPCQKQAQSVFDVLASDIFKSHHLPHERYFVLIASPSQFIKKYSKKRLLYLLHVINLIDNKNVEKMQKHARNNKNKSALALINEYRYLSLPKKNNPFFR